MKSTFKKALTIIMAVLTLVCIIPVHKDAQAVAVVVGNGGSGASFPTLTGGKVCHFVAQGSIPVYSNTGCTTRKGTITRYDACKITTITANYLVVTYPAGSSTKSGYVKPIDVFKVTSPSKFTAKLKITGCTTSDGVKGYGYIDAGDVVYGCTSNNGYTLAMYPVASGYKLAWFKTELYNAAKKGWPTVTSSKYITFTAESDIRPIYSNSSLTSTNSNWWIDPGDVCKIYAINSSSLAVSYPKSDGTYTETRYIAKSKVLPSQPMECFVATGKASVRLTKNGNLNTNYYIEAGDIVYGVKQSGDYTQVIYPVSGGRYRMAWLETSQYNRIKTQYDIPYEVLDRINGYKSKVSNANGLLVFLFEGKGDSSSASQRKNALCVTLKNGKIIYVNPYCTTIPDAPFVNDHPTLKSGIHTISKFNHLGYAGFEVDYDSAPVWRFTSSSSYSSSTSTGIDVHRRSNSGMSGSQGCQIIGRSGTGDETDYADFIRAVGLVNAGTVVGAYTEWQNAITGQLIVDRYYAKSYLEAIGYCSDAIDDICTNPLG